MRRLAVLALTAATIAIPQSAPSEAVPTTGGFASPNVRHVLHLPIDSPGVGARVVRVGKQIRFYITGVKGLSVYDVTRPEIPLLLGTAPLPHWENESLATSDDGAVAFVSHDANFEALDNKNSVTYVVDTSNPRLPHVASVIPDGTHTATCANPRCTHLYASEGWTYDVRDRLAPKKLARGWRSVVEGQGVDLEQGAHYLSRDDAGLVMTDTRPRVLIDPRRNPARPKVLTTGEVPQEARLSYQHNSLRPNATRWRPRAKGDKSRGLRPGELVLANGETNFKPQCDGTSNGPFATWSARDFNRGVPLRPLHVFRPRHNGTYADGDPTVNVLGCSGHWFTERRGLVAAGWYEHGTRFLKVNPKTGSIAEVGWFVPAAGSTSAAHWINDEYVYTVDYSRGIDVLRIDRKAKPPTRAQLDASWGRTANRGLAFFRQREQSLCRMATDRVS